MEISEHERASQHRFEDVERDIHHLKKEVEKMQPTTTVVDGGMGMGGALGGGLGAGLLGGILGGGLIGGNGLFGNRNGEGAVTPSQLQAAVAGVTEANNTSSMMETLGDIKGAIPAAEGQVQLALAQAQNALTNALGQQSVAAAQGFASVNDNVNRNTAGIIAVGETIKDTVNTTSAATQLGIANLATSGLQNTYAITQAINTDGEKTRALITAQNEANLQRQLAVAESRLAEERAEGRARATEINVTQTVTQNQLQMQQQQQAQQQLLVLGQIANLMGGLQNAVATNSNLIVGNSGAVATGPQTANPVNVRA